MLARIAASLRNKNLIASLSVSMLMHVAVLLEEWTSIEEQIQQVDDKIVERASRQKPGSWTMDLLLATADRDVGLIGTSYARRAVA